MKGILLDTIFGNSYLANVAARKFTSAHDTRALPSEGMQDLTAYKGIKINGYGGLSAHFKFSHNFVIMKISRRWTLGKFTRHIMRALALGLLVHKCA